MLPTLVGVTASAWIVILALSIGRTRERERKKRIDGVEMEEIEVELKEKEEKEDVMGGDKEAYWGSGDDGPYEATIIMWHVAVATTTLQGRGSDINSGEDKEAKERGERDA